MSRKYLLDCSASGAKWAEDVQWAKVSKSSVSDKFPNIDCLLLTDVLYNFQKLIISYHDNDSDLVQSLDFST